MLLLYQLVNLLRQQQAYRNDYYHIATGASAHYYCIVVMIVAGTKLPLRIKESPKRGGYSHIIRHIPWEIPEQILGRNGRQSLKHNQTQ